MVTFIETAFLHELSHLGLAHLLGIPVVHFYWIDPVLKVPSVYFDVDGWSWRLSMTQFGGGIIAGTVWGVLHGQLLRKGYLDRSGAWWAFGAWLAILTVWQFGQGLIEGALHGMYIDGARELGSASRMMQIAFMTMGFLLHVTATRASLPGLRRRALSSD
ncbi:MAG: hypothetical protein O2821_06785 [Chloroflexi bacterium]|nr:hypothetical protein [Chloroflexota bacterium]